MVNEQGGSVMIEFSRDSTLGEILEMLGEWLIESFHWWVEGAEKLATFDILNFDIGQTLITLFAIYLYFGTKDYFKGEYEKFNLEVDNVAVALKSKKETDDMIEYYRSSNALFHDETYKDLSDENLLKAIKKRFKRKRPHSFDVVSQFFYMTGFYWVAVFIYFITNYPN